MKYEAEVDRSAIMQDFQDNEKKNDNSRQAAILDCISAKFVMGYPCMRPYFLFYIHGPAIFLYHNRDVQCCHSSPLMYDLSPTRPFDHGRALIS